MFGQLLTGLEVRYNYFVEPLLFIARSRLARLITCDSNNETGVLRSEMVNGLEWFMIPEFICCTGISIIVEIHGNELCV